MTNGPTARRASNRSRSPTSERVHVPRLSLQNGGDIQASPRTPQEPRNPLSPRSVVPATPRGPRLGDEYENKASPRFGTPRVDENSPDISQISHGSLSARHRGSTLSARGLNSSRRKARTGSNGSASASNKRPNPLLNGSPQVRRPSTSPPAPPAAAPLPPTQSSPSHPCNNSRSRLSGESSSSAGSKSSAENFSGPSMVGENVASAHYSSHSSLAPYASTASLHMHGAHSARHSRSRGAADAPFISVGGGEDTYRRSSTYSSHDPHLPATSPVQSSSGRSLPVQVELDPDSDLFAGSGLEHIEGLCDKAAELVRQMGPVAVPPSSWESRSGLPAEEVSNLQTARSSTRSQPWSSSPGPLKNAGLSASPCTPPALMTTCSEVLCGGASPIDSRWYRSSPVPGAPEATHAGDRSLSKEVAEALHEMRYRVEVLEQERRAVQAPSSREATMLQGRLNHVEAELKEVRGELKQACAQMTQMMALLTQHCTPGALGAASEAASSAPTTARLSARQDHGTLPSGQVTPAAPQQILATSAPGVAEVLVSGSPRRLARPGPTQVQLPYTARSASYNPAPVSKTPYAPTSTHANGHPQVGTPPPTVRVHQTPIRAISSGVATTVQGGSSQWQTLAWRMPAA